MSESFAWHPELYSFNPVTLRLVLTVGTQFPFSEVHALVCPQQRLFEAK